MTFFTAADAIVAGIEAGFTKLETDPGNWTGGKVGVGELKGTKYGISAAAFPRVDIENLTLQAAQGLRKAKYWDVIGADSMTWERALCAYDCAINQGDGAEELLQAHSHGDVLEFMTQRALRYAAGDVERFGHSWFHRLFLVMKAAQTTPPLPT